MKSFDLKDSKQWSRMGPRAMFGQFMLDIAEKNEKLMVLSADLGRSSGLDRFKIKYHKYIVILSIIFTKYTVEIIDNIINETYLKNE